MLQKAGVVKISDKKKEEFELLEDFFSDYYKIFDEDLFPVNSHLECSESPDFIIKFDNEKIGIEITEAIKEEMMKSLDLEIEIYKIVQKYINEEDIKIVIGLFFSDKLYSDISKINKSKFIKAFTEEFKKYILARRKKEYSSFNEFCRSNKDFLICKYLVGEPIAELYNVKPALIKGSIFTIESSYKKKLKGTIDKKVRKLPFYQERVDKIYLLIKTSSHPPNDLDFLNVHIPHIKEILNSYTKGENNFDKIFLYYHSDNKPQIIKSD